MIRKRLTETVGPIAFVVVAAFLFTLKAFYGLS